MGIVVIGAVFVDIKGYPLSTYIPGGRNSGRVEQVHGGVSRNIVEDIANVELRPTFVSLVDDTGTGADVRSSDLVKLLRLIGIQLKEITSTDITIVLIHPGNQMIKLLIYLIQVIITNLIRGIFQEETAKQIIRKNA